MDYGKKTVDKLKKLCDERGIEYGKKPKKDQLVEALKLSDAAKADEAAAAGEPVVELVNEPKPSPSKVAELALMDKDGELEAGNQWWVAKTRVTRQAVVQAPHEEGAKEAYCEKLGIRTKNRIVAHPIK